MPPMGWGPGACMETSGSCSALPGGTSRGLEPRARGSVCARATRADKVGCPGPRALREDGASAGARTEDALPGKRVKPVPSGMFVD